MSFVFADYAGDINDEKQRLVVLVALIVSDEQLTQRIIPRCSRLKDYVASWGINVNRSDFEFHTVRIFNNGREWRGISEDQKHDVLQRLGQIIANKRAAQIRITPGVHFAFVVIDKDKGGMQGLYQFSKDLHEYESKVLTLLPDKERNAFETFVTSVSGRKGPGPLSGITGLLFGLTTGLMHWEGLKDDAETVVDKQFLKGVKGWKLVFQMLAAAWPVAKPRSFFPRWPKANQPDWHLGKTLKEEESYSSYGLQLADFLAYTTMRSFVRGPYDLANRVAILHEDKFVSFEGYKGILLAVSSKSRKRYIYKTVNRYRPRGWLTSENR